jgi:tetratricopeptide (TPR) repeat protein
MSELEFWKDIGNISEAILNYQKKNAEFNDRFINPWLRLGHVAAREDGNNEVMRAYQHATDIDPNNAQNWIDLGDMKFKTGAYEEARLAYQKAVDLAPQAGQPLNKLAYTLALQGNYAEAIPLYTASIELLTENQDKVSTWNHLGEAYRKLNDYEKAFLAFQQADELDGRKISIHDQTQNLPVVKTEEFTEEVEVEKTLNDREEAEEQVGQITSPETTSSQSTQTEGIVLPAAELEDGIFQNGLENENPNMLTEKSGIAEAQNKSTIMSEEILPSWLSEQHKSNLASLEDGTKNIRIPEWLVINKNDKEADSNYPVEVTQQANNSAGTIYFNFADESADSEEKIEALKDQLNDQSEADSKEPGVPAEEDPTQLVKNIDPMNASSYAFNRQTDEMAYEEYLKDVNEPVNILSDHIDEIQSQASQSRLSKKGQELLEMETKSAQVWNELGNVYLNSGSYDEAITAYGKAIGLERHYAWPYSNLALAYVQKGLLAEAILLYQRSIELFTLDKDKALTWNRLGNVYRRLNDYNNAIAAYQTADELDPGNAALSLRSSFGLLGNVHTEIDPITLPDRGV